MFKSAATASLWGLGVLNDPDLQQGIPADFPFNFFTPVHPEQWGITAKVLHQKWMRRQIEMVREAVADTSLPDEWRQAWAQIEQELVEKLAAME